MAQWDIPAEYRALYGFRADLFTDVAPNLRSAQGERIFKEVKGKWVFMPVTLGGIELYNPVIRVIGRKLVVETPMTERAGSVKEIISLEDYVINIKGIITRPDGAWPESELTELRDMYERGEAVDINSALTAVMLAGRDETVVITNLTLPEWGGQTQAIAYELEMVSDSAFDLILE